MKIFLNLITIATLLGNALRVAACTSTPSFQITDMSAVSKVGDTYTLLKNADAEVRTTDPVTELHFNPPEEFSKWAVSNDFDSIYVSLVNSPNAIGQHNRNEYATARLYRSGNLRFMSR